jgi:hypothetical protein
LASPVGTVSAKDQTGWSFEGAAIVMRMREPARYMGVSGVQLPPDPIRDQPTIASR